MFHAPPYRIILGVGQNECYRLEAAQSRDALARGAPAPAPESTCYRGERCPCQTLKVFFLSIFFYFGAPCPMKLCPTSSTPLDFLVGTPGFAAPTPLLGYCSPRSFCFLIPAAIAVRPGGTAGSTPRSSISSAVLPSWLFLSLGLGRAVGS